MDNLLHTPDGVRDIYNGECAGKQVVEQSIQKQLKLFGYEAIETPTFEFFDIFNRKRGSVASRTMFKFFDRDNNTLVLRPDMTPAIARCIAKFYREEAFPVRLCYQSQTFRNNTNYRGRLKEQTQSGAELVGNESVYADAEIIALVIECLKSTGLKEFQIDIGEVNFYKALIEQAKMSPEEDFKLREYIENKNVFGAEEYLNSILNDSNLCNIFLKLPEYFGSVKEISAVKDLTDNPKAMKSINRLEKIHEILSAYGLDEYISFDLGMLSQYDYYTGMIFKAYAHGSGDYIVNGGRYDKLIIQFGKDIPAVGFGISIDRLLSTLEAQHIPVNITPVDCAVIYDTALTMEAVKILTDLRHGGFSALGIEKKDGKSTEDCIKYAAQKNIRRIRLLPDSDHSSSQDGFDEFMLDKSTGKYI